MCVVHSAVDGTIAGSNPVNGVPRTIERPPENARRSVSMVVGINRPPHRRRRRDAPASGAPPIELRLEGVVLDESSLAESPMLPYVRMVVSLIEGVEFSCREVLYLLRQAMRQHSIGARRRIDYVLGFLNEHPP